MSGIGGYYFTLLHSNIANLCTYELTDDKSKITILTAKGTNKLINTFTNPIEVGDAYHYKVKVTGLDVFKQSFPNAYIQDGQEKRIKADGVYDVSGAATYTYVSLSLYAGQDITEGTAINITIEQPPLYPNALVSDGVDDYCLVEGLPLLNKEDGYTVIAKRTWIGDVNSKSQGFVSKGSSALWVDGAFYFECVEGSGTSLFNRVFPNSNSKDGVNRISSFAQENLTYLTSAKYNNSDIVNVGDGIDTDKLAVFKLTTSSSSHYYASISLYSLLLFNRDLTVDEINWVKTNLIS